jgi:hypothetical protein
MNASFHLRFCRLRCTSCQAVLALGTLCLMQLGCFMPRTESGWSGPALVTSRCAIMPVLPEQVRITVDAPRVVNPYEVSAGNSNVRSNEDVAHSINGVLDSIAAGKDNPLRGPAEIESVLKKSPQWVNLQVYLEDPGPSDEAWKVEGIAALCRELGLECLIIVSPTLWFKPNIDPLRPEPMSHHWDGRIEVEATMLDLGMRRQLAHGRGLATFYGYVGVVGLGGPGGGIVIPYAFGKAFDRAVDQAARQALQHILDIATKEQPIR